MILWKKNIKAKKHHNDNESINYYPFNEKNKEK